MTKEKPCESEATALGVITEPMERSIYDYLEKWPGNLAGAARAVGISRRELMDFRDAFPSEFERIDREYYDLLESLCRIKASGAPMPKGHEDFDFGKAFRILQIGRAASWAGTAQARAKAVEEHQKKQEAKVVKSSGKGYQITQEYLEGRAGVTVNGGEYDGAALRALDDKSTVQ